MYKQLKIEFMTMVKKEDIQLGIVNNPERREKGYETMYTESRKFYCD